MTELLVCLLPTQGSWLAEEVELKLGGAAAPTPCSAGAKSSPLNALDTSRSALGQKAAIFGISESSFLTLYQVIGHDLFCVCFRGGSKVPVKLFSISAHSSIS